MMRWKEEMFFIFVIMAYFLKSDLMSYFVSLQPPHSLPCVQCFHPRAWEILLLFQGMEKPPVECSG